MAGTTDEYVRWKEIAVAIEKQMDGGNLVTRETVESLLPQFREAYENAILTDFERSQEDGLEALIWTRNHKVIETFKRAINLLKKPVDGKKRPVEVRKSVASFVHFLKNTSRYYRDHIFKLASNFQIYELAPVLFDELKLKGSLEGSPHAARNHPFKRRVIRSVYRSLVYLGDLSRYRELYNSTKNWGPAIGHYDAARKLMPNLGDAQNQLAVIALGDQSSLSSIYHIYRSLCVDEPFANGRGNLEICLGKILKKHMGQQDTAESSRKEEHPIKELLKPFLTLHAKYGKDAGSSEDEKTQNELLSILAANLRERIVSNGMLMKLVYINVAAEYQAEKMEKVSRVAEFRKLNLQTFTTLLLIFQPELERNGEDNDHSAERVSAVGKRMLPSLRVYSKWLLKNHSKLTPDLGYDGLQTEQLWQAYADTLTIIFNCFESVELPRLEYPLNEDEEMAGFLPVEQSTQFDLVQRPFWTKDNSHRVHPNDEVLARIRLLLEDCGELCANKDVPVFNEYGTIKFREPFMQQPAHQSGSSEPEDYNFPDAEPFENGQHTSDSDESTPSEAGSCSMSLRMNAMVDSLVGPSGDLESEKSDDDEEVVFVGRNYRNLTAPGKKNPAAPVKSPVLRHQNVEPPSALRTTTNDVQAPPCTQVHSTGHRASITTTTTALDLVKQVQNFGQSLAATQPPLYTSPRFQHQPIPSEWSSAYTAGHQSSTAPAHTMQRSYTLGSPVTDDGFPSSVFYQSPRIQHNKFQPHPQPMVYSPWMGSSPTPGQGSPYQENFGSG